MQSENWGNRLDGDPLEWQLPELTRVNAVGRASPLP